jgi:formylglycine-generating enzyme required for sulfatase activity/tRNA A-37 threonylcarbamoyl transferase component Bud32
MSDEAILLQLLEEILESNKSPEDVCVEFPELLPEVHKRLNQLQCVQARVDALFPTTEHFVHKPETFDSTAEPPRIPGYEVVALLGRGGMGVVYKARHVKLNRTVAIKMMLAGAYADRQQLKRFMQEAVTVAGLRHAHIVQVYDVADLEGLPYFTMEFVGGGSLAQKLAGVPQPARESAALVATLSEAVHLAHQSGIVHRDLKPSNILLTADGTPKISDFGLARRVDGESALTLSGASVGTPSYMPPEQAIGKAGTVGPPVDIYALGAILYEMLTGRPPFKGETAAETVRQLIEEETVPPSRLNAKVPRDLETICLKCLQKDPQRRYATAAALADDLGRFQRAEAILARPAGLWERAFKRARRRPTAAALAGVSLVGVIALVVGAVNYNRQLDETRRSTRAATLVQALVAADTPDLPPILEDLEPYQHHADPLLARILAEEPVDSKARLHASLAVLPRDDSQVEYLLGRLLTATPQELLAIRAGLAPHRDRVNGRLWGWAEDESTDDGRRFRAACSLATLDPDSPRWVNVAPDVAAKLVAENLLRVGAWTDLLRPARHHLLLPLTGIALHRTAHEPADADPELRFTEFQQNNIAVSILADYAGDKPQVLADLIVEVGPKPFDVLYPRIAAHGDHAAELLVPVIEQTLSANTPDSEYDRHAQRKANAAIALLRLGHADRVWPLLRHSPDPSHRSYLIHRFARLGADPLVLRRRFDTESDTSARRALVLALGEFAERRVAQAPGPPADGQLDVGPAVWLLRLYQADPDPGIHAAASWTLRQWDHGKELAKIDKELSSRRDSKVEDHRSPGWWVNSQGQTMVRIPGPVEFRMGSPQSEPKRDVDEVLHSRRIGRSFAIAAHHVTVAQFKRFNSKFTHDQMGRAKELDCPIIGVTWYEAAQYCNWLSKQDGLPESQWCYLPDRHGKYTTGMRLAPDYLQRRGYRLPTEAEWEYCCRAGAGTPHCYGRSEELLPKYAWSVRNSREHSWPVGTLKPNDFGLFDMHGNAWCWCLDGYLSYQPGSDPRFLFRERASPELAALMGGTHGWPMIVAALSGAVTRADVPARGDMPIEDVPYHTLVTEGVTRVMRGGSFLYPAGDLRSANRNWVRPSYRNYNVGFRVAKTIVDEAKSGDGDEPR